MTRHLFAASLATLALTAPVWASVEDRDGDGSYSFNEMLAAYPALTEETFISIDTNGDGAVDEAELATAVETGLLPAG